MTPKPKYATPPKSWPKTCSTIYITEPVYSSKFTSDTLVRFHSIPSSCSNNGKTNDTCPIMESISPGPSPLVLIRQITNMPSHPANSQHGLFATRKLSPGSFVLFYLGHVHPSTDSDPTSNYDLSMDSELGIAVDGAKFGNEARFINDFRGIAERANAEFKDVWVRTTKGGTERRMGVFVIGGKNKNGGIGKGEEILVSYGKGFWDARKNT